MDKLKMHYRSKTKGQVLAILIIVLGLIGVGAWWLYSTREAMAKEGREFGKEAIQRIVLQRDLAFFSSRLSPAARQDYPPSAQQDLISRLQQLGTPVGPLDVQGNIQFQSQFFEPHGVFNARLNYPARSGQIEIATSHPVGRWQIDTLSLTLERER
jgi:hypothetical protein